MSDRSDRRVLRGSGSRRAITATVLTCVWLFAFAPAAVAQSHAGARAGVSVGPDQFYFGGHLDRGPLVERLWFRPNLEIGLGSGTLIALNVEFVYRFPVRERPPLELYVGAGPALNIFTAHRDRDSRRFGERDTEVGGGFNILVGAAHREGLFMELKVAALDSPELKFGVGYSFR